MARDSYLTRPREHYLTDVVPYVAEFVGTYMLVFTMAWTALATAQVVWPVTAYACLLVGLVYSLEPVSGAHLNPALTLCCVLTGKTKVRLLLGYWAAQLAGAILGGITCAALLHVPSGGEHAKLVFLGRFAAAEAMYTCLLCFVVLNVTCHTSTMGNEFYGLAIGFVYIAGGYAVGALSGASFNPAVTLGYDVARFSIDSWQKGVLHCIGYIFWQFVGAAAAAGLFRLVRPDEHGGEPDQLATKCASEFIGSFFFVLTVGFNVIQGSSTTAWSAAACILSTTYSLATVSGAHFNPIVSLGLMLSGRQKLGVEDGLAYMGAQTGAAILAGLVVGIYAMVDDTLHETPLLSMLDARYPAPTIFLTELVFSSALVFVWLCASSTREPSEFFFGLAIAACLQAGALASGPVSGVGLNPACCAGLAAAALLQHGACSLRVFCALLAEALGAAVGAAAFRLLFRREYGGTALERAIGLPENPMGTQVGVVVGGHELESDWKEGLWSLKNRSCSSCTSRWR